MEKEDFKFKIFVSNYEIKKLRILYPKPIYEQSIMFDFTKNNGKVDLGFMILEVENNDGFIEKINRDVKIIPKDKDIIAIQIIEDRSHGYTSIDYKIYLIKSPNGEVHEITDQIKEETDVVETGKYQMERVRYYIEYAGKKLYFSEIDKNIRKMLKVNIRVENNKTTISGDTYLLRFVLRSLKFDFDKEKKIWYRDGVDYNDVKEKLQETEQKFNLYTIKLFSSPLGRG